MKRTLSVIVFVLIVVSLLVGIPTNKATASTFQQDKHWCGNGSEADNFGFTYALTQPHWTIGNDLVSEQTMADVDVILDKLNSDKLVQTMILVIPEDQVGIPVNCAVHFLRYMKLGMADNDNGFTFLFVIGQDQVTVYYGVGMDLPALTAPHLGELKRLGSETYSSTKSIDTALLETVKAYDKYVRSEYGPTSGNETTDNASPQPESSTGIWEALGTAVKCIVIFFIIIIIVAFLLIGGGLSGGSSGGGFRSSSSSSSFSSSSRSSSSSSRSGTGSGRSGRGG